MEVTLGEMDGIEVVAVAMKVATASGSEGGSPPAGAQRRELSAPISIVSLTISRVVTLGRML